MHRWTLKVSPFLKVLRGKEHVMGAVLGAGIIYPKDTIILKDTTFLLFLRIYCHYSLLQKSIKM